MKPIQPLVKLAVGMLLVLGVGVSEAAEDIKQTLFKQVDTLFEEAREKQADLLSPRNFGKAIEMYKRAETALRQEKSLEKIQADLREAEGRLKQALETSRLAEITFGPVLTARARARVAQASELSGEFWREAEEAFVDAAEDLEKGDVKAARKKVEKVVHRYRKAEIDALKTHYLSDARNLLKHAEEVDADDYAPQTLHQAWRQVKLADAKLNRQDFDPEEVGRLAEQAQRTAQHAVHLALEIRKLMDDQNLERFVLDWEKRLAQISETADLEASFKDDWNDVTERIVERIRSYRSQAWELEDQLDVAEKEVQRLQDKVLALDMQLEDRRKARERVATVEQLFEDDEATVLQKGNALMIRLYGLKFRTGQARIESEHYYLLGKVQEAIKQFPDALITLEGHTDSYGDAKVNRVLSENRALAVRDYLLANTNLSPLRIEAVGLGEAHPIASNDSPEGRSQNRRIDVIFHLNRAQPSLGVRAVETEPLSF